MKLALEKWEPGKPLVLRMLAHELATGAEAVYHLCELARQGENVERAVKSASWSSRSWANEAAGGSIRGPVEQVTAGVGGDRSTPERTVARPGRPPAHLLYCSPALPSSVAPPSLRRRGAMEDGRGARIRTGDLRVPNAAL